MFLLLVPLVVVPGLVTLPGWLWARRKRPQSVWLLFLVVPGLITWFAFASMGIGHQGLGNVVELFALAGAAIIAAYAKFVVLDRWLRRGGVIALIAVIAVTVALRLLIPAVPE